MRSRSDTGERGAAGPPRAGPPDGADGVAGLYGETYADRYPALYIEPWRRKHVLNARNLTRVLDVLPADPAWLDLACGQAWHFARFEGRARMLGLDRSFAQLRRARLRVPSAAFVCADMTRAPLRPATFDLVTNFWAGYCYLDSEARIRALLRDAKRWIRPGGALYFEVLLAGDLADFNRSQFADGTGFAVVPRSDDYVRWRYDDVGGRHLMTSPPLAFFLDIIAPDFERLEALHDGGFMVHLIASGRRR